MVRGIEKESKYHLNGSAHVFAHVKKFVFTLAMCSHSSDSLPLALLETARLSASHRWRSSWWRSSIGRQISQNVCGGI